MAHTPLMRMLRQFAYEHSEASNRGISVEQVRSEPALPRRDFLKYIGIAAAAAILPLPLPIRASQHQPRIAIVGGGVAGLNAALTLSDAGYPSTIYEADSRIGGRIHSITDGWENGQVSEWCGELIDSNHTTIQSLAQRFNLVLDDLRAAEPKGSTETYYFFCDYYTVAQADQDLQPVLAILSSQNTAASYPTLYNSSTEMGRYLDRLSIHDWIGQFVPGGHASPLGKLLDVAYDIEFGLPTREQSSLNLVYLLPGPTDDLSLFGFSDERYHIRGGNDQLVRAMADSLPFGSIELNHRLTAIAKQHDGSIQLTFRAARANGETSTKPVSAERVILALPFSVLRNLDYTRAGFDRLKKTAIEHLGYGTNAKLMLQFQQRLWNQAGPWGLSNGYSYSDTGYQNAWDTTRAQLGATGILVNYLGSPGAVIHPDRGDESFSSTSPAVRAYAARFLNQLDPVFPGLSSLYSGTAALSSPKDDPNLRGSYSCWKVGQYTAFSGYEGVRQGRIHFAGEHCSTNFQGYMEGGAAEGSRAANEILADLQAGDFP
jgi:monoamine oxidase